MAIFQESRNIVFFFLFLGSFVFFWFCVCVFFFLLFFCFFWFWFFCFFGVVFLVFPELASEDFEMDFPWVVLDSFH